MWLRRGFHWFSLCGCGGCDASSATSGGSRRGGTGATDAPPQLAAAPTTGAEAPDDAGRSCLLVIFLDESKNLPHVRNITSTGIYKPQYYINVYTYIHVYICASSSESRSLDGRFPLAPPRAAESPRPSTPAARHAHLRSASPPFSIRRSSRKPRRRFCRHPCADALHRQPRSASPEADRGSVTGW